MRYRLVIGIVLIVLVVLFIAQNTVVVEIQLLFWSLTMSRALMVFLVLLLGIVAGWLLHGARRRRR